jgi:hypothetical protein
MFFVLTNPCGETLHSITTNFVVAATAFQPTKIGQYNIFPACQPIKTAFPKSAAEFIKPMRAPTESEADLKQIMKR